MRADDRSVPEGSYMREETLNWAHGQRTTMTAFLSRYTLHDADVHECALSADGSAVLTVAWDRVWLEAPFTQAGLPVPEDPWLFLQFPQVLLATIDDTATKRAYENGTVARGDSEQLSLDQRERLRAALVLLRALQPSNWSTTSEPDIPEGTECTTVQTVLGRRITLYHSPDVVVLCQEAADDRLLHVPGL
jgi:hypothetical protein